MQSSRKRQHSLRRTSRRSIQPLNLPASLVDSGMRSSVRQSTSVERLSPPSSRSESLVIQTRSFPLDASLVLVGIRGSGKRSLGFVAAAALGRRLITGDHYFHDLTGLSRQEYLTTHGTHEFHQQDIEISQRMMDDNRLNCVIECGLGSLTNKLQEYLQEYAKTNPIVYIVRDMREIRRFLSLGDRSAKLLENGDPTHRRCSNYEYYNLEDHSPQNNAAEGESDRQSPLYSFKLKEAKEDFTNFVRFVTGAHSYRSNHDSPFSLLETPVHTRLFTHVLQIRLSELSRDQIELSELQSGADAIELCVDQWSRQSYKDLGKQISRIRRYIGVPIVLSVDTPPPKNGSDKTSHSDLSDDLRHFAGYQSEDVYMEILDQGLRIGVDYLVVDLSLKDDLIAHAVRSKGSTRIIGHHQRTSQQAPGWMDDYWSTLYLRAGNLGCDIVRLLRRADSRHDNDLVRMFSEKMRESPGKQLPLIAYNIGSLGRTSQLFNVKMTAVTHTAIIRDINEYERPLITASEAVQGLFQSFVLDPLQFCILGVSVSYSLSPYMHNTAYQICGLSHNYSTRDITSLDILDELAQNPNFGGASIVHPWKVAVLDRLSSRSRHAEAIGAINTLLPLRALKDGPLSHLTDQANQRNRSGTIRGWHGENTDWIGIMICLDRNLSPRNAIRPSKTTSLVIGAGGMARAAIYALLRLGCRKIFLFNRTVNHAQSVASHFNEWASSSATASGDTVSVFRSEADPWPAGCDAPTMIVSCIPAESVDGRPPADFKLPAQWLHSESGGTVLEMAYKPLDTPLLKQIWQLRKVTGQPWTTVDGLEMLAEQGSAQFELMTGRKAPKKRMKLEVMRNYHHP